LKFQALKHTVTRTSANIATGLPPGQRILPNAKNSFEGNASGQKRWKRWDRVRLYHARADPDNAALIAAAALPSSLRNR
jgi:hypothetical protein